MPRYGAGGGPEPGYPAPRRLAHEVWQRVSTLALTAPHRVKPCTVRSGTHLVEPAPMHLPPHTYQPPASADNPLSFHLLPFLPHLRVPKVTLLYDLEAIKPFTQQAPSAAPSLSDTASHADTPASASAAAAASSRGGGAGSARGGGQSRLAAAGLVPSSSPDLVAALDQLVRTLAEYGAVHAVHLFLRESTLAKAPALRKQVRVCVCVFLCACVCVC